MYKVIKNGRKLRILFDTYEMARSHARKLLRKELNKFDRSWDISAKNYRNPALNYWGFEIERVK